jgi:hypothetical protein
MTETWRPTATRAALTARADMLRTIRNCFDRLGMLEVETPTLSHAGGTDVALASIEARVGGTTCYLLIGLPMRHPNQGRMWSMCAHSPASTRRAS